MNEKQKEFLVNFDRLHQLLTAQCLETNLTKTGKKFLPFMEAVRTTTLFTSEDVELLKLCASMRNIIAHNTHWDGACDPIDVVSNGLAALIKLVEKKAIDIAVTDVYTAKFGDKLKPHVNTMIENIYTHVPVLNYEGIFVGTLSENSIVKYIFSDEPYGSLSILTEELVHHVNSDSNEKIKFKSVDASLIDIFKLFEVYERTGAVFLTGTGDCKGDIKGIITSADLNFKSKEPEFGNSRP